MKRKDKWTLAERCYSLMQRPYYQPLLIHEPILLPEVFDPDWPKFENTLKQVDAPVFAIFHDAIPWLFPYWSTTETRLKHIQYMRMLFRFDGIISVSRSSLEDLKKFWISEGYNLDQGPILRVIPLGVDGGHCHAMEKRDRIPSDKVGDILMVATFEARKNHVVLLNACRQLWDEGWRFNLRLVGGVNQRTGRSVEILVKDLKKAGYSIFWDGVASQAQISRFYAESDLVVFPSFYEGFGLPVIEAQSFGKPVLCSRGGALCDVEELGCRFFKGLSTASVKEGILSVISNPATYREMIQELKGFNLRTWDEVGREIREFVDFTMAEKA